MEQYYTITWKLRITTVDIAISCKVILLTTSINGDICLKKTKGNSKPFQTISNALAEDPFNSDDSQIHKGTNPN